MKFDLPIQQENNESCIRVLSRRVIRVCFGSLNSDLHCTSVHKFCLQIPKQHNSRHWFNLLDLSYSSRDHDNQHDIK